MSPRGAGKTVRMVCVPPGRDLDADVDITRGQRRALAPRPLVEQRDAARVVAAVVGERVVDGIGVAASGAAVRKAQIHRRGSGDTMDTGDVKPQGHVVDPRRMGQDWLRRLPARAARGDDESQRENCEESFHARH